MRTKCCQMAEKREHSIANQLTLILCFCFYLFSTVFILLLSSGFFLIVLKVLFVTFAFLAHNVVHAAAHFKILQVLCR